MSFRSAYPWMTMPELPDGSLVKAWMNPPEHTVAPDDNADEAFAHMKRAGVRHLLVMKDGELVGVVTDRDLRRPDWDDGKPISTRDMYLIGDDLMVHDVMTQQVLTAAMDDTIVHAAKVMVENKINCLPVLRDERVVGILTSSDLLAALVYGKDPEEQDF